jgi:two-component system sensor histidine kinase RegB
LVRLRWVAVAGQLAAGVAVLGLGWPARVEVSAAVLLLTAISNAWLGRARDPSQALIFSILALDIVLLTALLGAAGGAANPFTSLYIVHITLAAVVLGLKPAGALGLLSLAGYALLFALTPDHAGHGAHAEHGGGVSFSLHLYGMWLSLGLSSLAIAYFIARLSVALNQRESELAAFRERSARVEKLAALSTLAAGAAHELGTPLGTIAIAAKELEFSSERITPEVLREEARLIRAEVLRCREIIDRLRGHAGESVGEAPQDFPCSALFADVLDLLGGRAGARLRLDPAPEIVLHVPRRALVQALVNLVNNGLDASEKGAVLVSVALAPQRLTLCVKDEGAGMSPEMLARVGEPFFTTKAPGHGMGLGLFLTKSLADQLGGEFTLRSTPGQGTTACLSLPRPRIP